MTHLTDEQLEDLLHGDAAPPPHLADCAECSARLAERRAVRRRLRGAMAAVGPDAGFAEQLVARLRTVGATTAREPAPADQPAAAPQAPPRRRTLRLPRYVWPTLAAAAVLAFAVPTAMYLFGPQPVAAAELYDIHRHAISGRMALDTRGGPQKLAAFLRGRLGFEPAHPRPDVGMKLRGCCVAHFRNKPAGSYVVDTDRGVISVIVVNEKAGSLGMSGRLTHGRRDYWSGSFAKCRMVAFEMGPFTYCAVGEVSHEFLAGLLDQLLPQPPPAGAGR